MSRLRPALTSLLAWAAGATAAVAVGLLALSLIRSGLTDDAFQPITPEAVGQTEPGPSVAASASTGPVTTPTAGRAASAERRATTAGGTVVARCQGGLAYLVYWTPEPDFKADHVTRGPAAQVRVTFEAPGREITVTFVCVGGVPEPTVRHDWGDDSGHE
ncbi:MAG: hypothetical protein ACM30G_06170 [Micromonosporaceae bacterium]